VANIADTEMVGSVGTLIGASLETCGHYLQSELLTFLAEGVSGSLGAFLYILSALVALFLMTIGGNYKFGLWFFVGPPLFWFMITTRVESKGAQWQFGSVYHDSDVLSKTTNGVADRDIYAQVALPFAVWNRVSTGFVQAFIEAVQMTDVRGDIAFVSRFEKYADIFNVKITDGNLMAFMQLVVLGGNGGTGGNCATYYGLKLALHDPSRLGTAKEDIETQLAVLDKVKAAVPGDNYYDIIQA